MIVHRRTIVGIVVIGTALLAPLSAWSEVPAAIESGDIRLWVESTPHHSASGTAISKGDHSSNTAGPMTFGSQEIRQLGLRVLGQHHFCGAIAMMRFIPVDTPESAPLWHSDLEGMPMAATVELVSRGADAAAIRESLQPFWPAPYSGAGGLWLTSRITTEAAGPDQYLSSIVTTLVDDNGVPVSAAPVEPIVRLLWSRHDHRLLAVFLAAKETA
jgi:hypothetical protein